MENVIIFKVMISNRVKKFNSKEVREIFKAASQIDDPINLSIGEPDFDIPEEVKEEAIEQIRAGFNHYTPSSGIEDLRKRLSSKLLSKNKISASADDIAITTGVSAGLLVTILILVDKDDEVLVLDPYFPTYPELVKLAEGKPVFIDTYPDFSLPLDKIERAITSKTKAIIINSPNNPTGAVYSEESLKGLAAIAKKHNLTVISDEIYEDYVFEGKHFSIGSIYENTVSLWGFSKTYAMTGWRLGYMTGKSEFMERVHELLQYLYFSPPSIPQKAAIKALEIGPPKEILAKFKLKRDYLLEKLSKKFEIAGGQGAFYLFAKVPVLDTDKFLEKAMEKKVFMLPGKVFSQRNSHVRISYSVNFETLEKAVKALNSLV